MSQLIKTQQAEEYLSHAYEIPVEMPILPLQDEPFVSQWQKAEGRGVLDFLAEHFLLPVAGFAWQQEKSLRISFASTLGGRLPVISTDSHGDFCAMESLLNGREEGRELPLTVNAFAFQARAASIFHHRVLLLNRAPYSNVPAERLGLARETWLEQSHSLRYRHECAHYETLRLLGGMKNHALDEIMADALGQIAAFGCFDADRQRLFFGLVKGKDTCTGRLSFYCQKLAEEERGKVYQAVDEVLDLVAEEVNDLLAQKAGEQELLFALAGKSIAQRLM